MKVKMQSAWTHRLSWPIWLTAAWVIYQLTTQPALGATVACLKLGFSDVQTACWLRRIDRNAGRGRTCFWFYLTWGLLKVVWISYFAIFAAILCWMYAQDQGVLRHRFGEPLPKILTGLITLVTGTLLALLAGLTAFATAKRSHQKVWLDSVVNDARKQNEWPPPRFDENKAHPMMVFIGCALLFWMILLPAVAVPIAAFDALSWAPMAKQFWAVLVGVAGITAIACAQPCWARLRDEIVAATPVACWGNAEDLMVHRIEPGGPADMLPREEGPPDVFSSA